jgi:hypothetical protein
MYILRAHKYVDFILRTKAVKLIHRYFVKTTVDVLDGSLLFSIHLINLSIRKIFIFLMQLK